MSIDTTDERGGQLGQVGRLLVDRYRIEEVIGRGGMATVYRATDEALGRTVAIKSFRDDLADADDVRRQRDEIRLIAGLNHFALVTLFDAVADDSVVGEGNAFIVMQYVDGEDLRHRLSRGPLDPRTAALMGADVADALAYVHGRGVVHRDVKPGNILLPERESEVTGPRAMLADFGIARIVDGTRLTATGSVLGTASYLSPEQAAGTAVSGATDVYSLGLVLIECLTGDKSFPGTALESVAARLSSDPVVPDGFGPEWEVLLRSMTVRDPGERIGALAAAAALREIALTQPEVVDATMRYPASDTATVAMAAARTQAHPATRATQPATVPSVGHPSPPRRRGAGRGRILAIAGIVAAALALIVLAGLWFINSRAPSPHATTTTISYPSVPGDLGVHLKQLERAVTP